MASKTPESNIESVTIDDFTPGIWRFGRGNYATTYTPAAPLGSAAHAFRCYAIPDFGLCPLPTYFTTTPNQSTFSTTGNQAGGFLAIGGIVSEGAIPTILQEFDPTIVPGTTADFLYITLHSWNGSGASKTSFAVWSLLYSSNNVFLISEYTSTSANNGAVYTLTPFVQFVTVANPIGISVICIDPLGYTNTTFKYLTFAGGGATPGTVAVPMAIGVQLNVPLPLVQAERVLFKLPLSSAGSAVPSTDTFYISAINSLSGFTPNAYEPSSVPMYGAWGSISAGELVLIGQANGGVLVYGDPFAPDDVIRLPGIIGTGICQGAAAASTSGLIYATASSGAYIWNGGNTSSKISGAIPDDSFARNFYNLNINYAFETGSAVTHHATWCDWTLFANNWLWDSITEGWWLCEDPTVNNFQLHCSSLLSDQFFYSAPGMVVSTGQSTLSLSVYQWNKNAPASSYTWISNPIPGTAGYLTLLESVEIVASNPSPTPVQIVVTPQVPTGQTPFPGNNAQSVTFTIPATTVASRQKATLGYTDYNVEVGLVASNTNPANQAPIIHEMTLEYSTDVTSSVEL
jgi:hypothetical protein